jgi:hypothetical protein
MKMYRRRNIREIGRLRRRSRILEMSSVTLSLIHKTVLAATIYSTGFNKIYVDAMD